MNKNYKKVLKKKITLWQKINLTRFEYWGYLKNPYYTSKKHLPDFCEISHATLMSLCNQSRDYIDIFLRDHSDIIQRQPIKTQMMIYSDFGLVLYDIGYKDEGILYMQKSIDLCPSEYKGGYTYVFSLCSRLNDVKYNSRRLALAQKWYENGENKPLFDIIAVKSYIYSKSFDKAEETINYLAKYYNSSCVNIFKAELYFEKKQFDLASKFYSKSNPPGELSFWRFLYDYKKALAYYYAGWDKNWRKQAMKIKRRKQWDKYYDIENLNECGIERNKEIDTIINSESNNLVFDFDRMIHYLRMLIKIAYQLIKANWPYLFLIFALTIYIVDKLKN